MLQSPAVRIQKHGGPGELRLVTVSVEPPVKGELLVRQTAIGVNYHDIYVRSGLYNTLVLPGIPGIEGVGIVEAVGEGVQTFAPGDRIGYVAPEYGAYAALRRLPANRAMRLPPGLDDVAAAGCLMKALTAGMLLRKVHVVQPNDVVLVHAAAGGVGQLLCRWARQLGAIVIGSVGSPEKADIARRAGAAHTILYRQEDVAERVEDITSGEGAAVVYDSVGEQTFLKSLASLGYRGQLVLFGQSSGPVSPFPPALLAARSTSVSRPIIFHYLRTPESTQAMLDEVVEAFETGGLAPLETVTFPLGEAAEAHRLLEARGSPGAVVLIP